VDSQAPVSLNVTSAAKGGKQVPDGGRKTIEHSDGVNTSPERSSDGKLAPSQLTRVQAEAKFTILLFSVMTIMETLEMAVQAAFNTKLEIKTAVRSMGANLREFNGLAKKLGMVRNPDAAEQRVKSLQQLQLQQHLQDTQAAC